MLEVEGGEETAPEMRGIESFEDFFVAVSERAVAQKKSAAAEREIFLMGGDDAVHYENGARAIVTPLPFFSFGEDGVYI